MLRILHLSDCHLNNQNLKDWNSYVKEPLLKKIESLRSEKSIDLILCTGDLIDKGGQDFACASDAFEKFNTEIITPLLKVTELTVDKFLIVPGNHDVIRSKDKERIELGNIEWFKKDKKNISEFIINSIKEDDFSGMERIIDFKQFEKKLYSNIPNSDITNFGSTFKLLINSTEVGVSCLNSSWRCYKKDDMGNLIIGEDQLSRSYNYIKNSEIKIALIHHPLDWLSTVERGIITNHIYNDYDLLFLGHVHENKTSIYTGFTGSIFINVAPSGLNDIRSDSRTFANGFSLIDYDKPNGLVNCKYYRYNHNKKEFVLNTDEGILNMSIPDQNDEKKIFLNKTVLSNIKEDHYKEMDEHLIGVKAEKEIVSIKEGFILPPINQGNHIKSDNKKEKNINITDIVKSKSNQMFFGNQESGKTTLLYRLVREYADEYDYLRKIPVYINFEEIGNREILTCIKDYIRCGTKDAKYLLESNQLTLLIDNLNYKKNGDTFKTRKINNFVEENEGTQIIATADNNISGILPSDYINLCSIPFKTFFIRSLRTKEIKSLMKQWNPSENEIKSDEKLDKLVNSFNSFALPSTAMSVSLFLWSIENKERKPINQAVLLEIYIEIILEKLNKENIYRDHFDFTNKVQLIAKIANEMLVAENPNYSILYSEFIRVIEYYLKNEVGFDFDAKVIADYMFDRRLFVKYQGNRVKFTYLCFFHFFIAKRMEYNPEFRTYIMDESRYFLFNNEINYYTGLTRSDETFFTEVYRRFEENFNPTDYIIEGVNIDKHFTEIGINPHEPISKNIEIKKIEENRPSEELLEKFYDKQLEQIPDPNTILKKEGNISLETMMIIMSNVLRNSEGVENRELKKKAYYSLVKYSMIWMILYKETLVRYVLKYKKLPPSIPYEINLEYLLKNIPFQVQLGLFHHLGTAKLAPIILEKIKEDQKGDRRFDIEAFLSVALYSDIEGANFPKYLKKFVKKVGNNIVRDYILYKLLYYYYRRTREGSPNEEIYIDIIAELKIRSQKLTRRMRDRVIKSIVDGKNAFKKKNID